MTNTTQAVCPCRHDLGENVAVKCRTLASLLHAKDNGDHVRITTLDGRYSLHLQEFYIDGAPCDYVMTGRTTTGDHVVTVRFEWAYGYDLCLRGTAVVDRWPWPCNECR